MTSEKKFVPRAVLRGITTFITLYVLFIIVGSVIGAHHGSLLLSLQLLTFLLSGYVAAWVAGQRGWFHGMIVGIPLPLVIAIGFVILAQGGHTQLDILWKLVVVWLLQSIALCALGGFIFDIQLYLSKLRQRP